MQKRIEHLLQDVSGCRKWSPRRLASRTRRAAASQDRRPPPRASAASLAASQATSRPSWAAPFLCHVVWILALPRGVDPRSAAWCRSSLCRVVWILALPRGVDPRTATWSVKAAQLASVAPCSALERRSTLPGRAAAEFHQSSGRVPAEFRVASVRAPARLRACCCSLQGADDAHDLGEERRSLVALPAPANLGRPCICATSGARPRTWLERCETQRDRRVAEPRRCPSQRSGRRLRSARGWVSSVAL